MSLGVKVLSKIYSNLASHIPHSRLLRNLQFSSWEQNKLHEVFPSSQYPSIVRGSVLPISLANDLAQVFPENY